MKRSVSRSSAIKRLASLPVAALVALTFRAPAQAAGTNSKKQFKYQNRPGPQGEKCDACRYFRKPSACTIVKGTIRPNGWCIAWAPK